MPVSVRIPGAWTSGRYGCSNGFCPNARACMYRMRKIRKDEIQGPLDGCLHAERKQVHKGEGRGAPPAAASAGRRPGSAAHRSGSPPGPPRPARRWHPTPSRNTRTPCASHCAPLCTPARPFCGPMRPDTPLCTPLFTPAKYLHTAVHPRAHTPRGPHVHVERAPLYATALPSSPRTGPWVALPICCFIVVLFCCIV